MLEEILNTFGAEIIDFIVVAGDKNVTKDFATEILTLANSYNLRIHNRNSTYQIRTKYAIAISWRWLISYDEDLTQLIVFHDSLLPKYRGFAPLVNQLIQKEPVLGVTAFVADAEFDRGNIIDKRSVGVSYPIKIKDAIKKLVPLYSDMARSIIGTILKNKELDTTEQDEEQATYSLWRDLKDYEIDWSLHAEDIKRFIDAVGFPYLGASSKLHDRKIRIMDAHVEKDLTIVNRDHGKTLFSGENYVVVVCGKGLLKITEAIYDDTKKSIFPLHKFRLRFA